MLNDQELGGGEGRRDLQKPATFPIVHICQGKKHRLHLIISDILSIIL